jgi:hypothetical protein
LCSPSSSREIAGRFMPSLAASSVWDRRCVVRYATSVLATAAGQRGPLPARTRFYVHLSVHLSKDLRRGGEIVQPGHHILLHEPASIAARRSSARMWIGESFTSLLQLADRVAHRLFLRQEGARGTPVVRQRQSGPACRYGNKCVTPPQPGFPPIHRIRLVARGRAQYYGSPVGACTVRRRTCVQSLEWRSSSWPW